MAAPRRQIIRPTAGASPTNLQRDRLLQKLRQRLQDSRVALSRWQTRLRRAFNSVDKLQRTISRLELRIRKTEES